MAQNSPGANSKPEEVPKSLRVRMRARSITTQPVHTATISKQKKVPKSLHVRIRALDYYAAGALGNKWEVPKRPHVRMRAR